MSWLRKVLADKLPPDKLELVPRGFEHIGHVAILSLPPELEPWTAVIASTVLDVGGVRTVAVRRGPIHGWARKPVVEVVAGENQTETLHKENGCYYKLDVARVMFSKGNTYERQRVAKLVRDGEVVVDLFAGIGQFAIQIAKHARPSRVFAIEKNPVAYRYLCENIRINKVGHVVVPIYGDCREMAPVGVADRVVMGILHVGHLYLPLALKTLRPSGGIIHYHETSPCRLGFERAMKRVREAAGTRRIEFLEKRVVKRYSPGVNHVVLDVLVGPADTSDKDFRRR